MKKASSHSEPKYDDNYKGLIFLKSDLDLLFPT